MEKGARFSQRCFLHKRFKTIGREGSDALTKDMDQIYRQTFLYYIYYRLESTGEQKVSGGYNYSGAKEHNKKTQSNNGVQWKTK